MKICNHCKQSEINEAVFCGNCGTKFPADDNSFINKLINGKYLVKERIGKGAMGEVYLAQHLEIKQSVAIKRLHKELYKNERLVQRFINEARSYGRISHPNAVKIFDLINVNGELCIIMEYVEGKPLSYYVRNHIHFTNAQIIHIAIQLADALATAHNANIIHRDLKPENIMLSESLAERYFVSILDFGIAKMLDSPPDLQTEEGLIFGTPEFMSPEQALGEAVDARSDIYAYGGVLYYIIAENFPLTAPTKIQLLHKQINVYPPPLKRPPSAPPVNQHLYKIVEKCLKKQPFDRYQSFIDILLDLQNLSLNPNEIRPKTPFSPNIISLNQLPNVSPSTNKPFAKNHQNETPTFSTSIVNTKTNPNSDDEFIRSLKLDSSTENEAFSLGNDDDEEDLSLGDLDLEEPTHVYDKTEKKSSPIPLILLIIFLAIAAFSAYYFYFSDLFPKTTTTKPNNEQNTDTKQKDLATTNTTPEKQNQITPPSTNTEELPPLPKSDKPQQIPPSTIISLNLIESSILQSFIEAAQIDIKNTQLGTALILLSWNPITINEIDPDLKIQRDNTKAKITAIQNILINAENFEKRLNCREIENLKSNLEPDDAAYSERLDAHLKKCEKKLAAPPLTL